ncbi:MAG: methylenetetrahydrofolate reductase [NAD(P)H] [Pirellulales bacterium]
MSISQAYATERFVLSFELFPPKTAEAEAELSQHVAALMKFRPNFVTCTYGAGGSTRDKTLDVVEQVHRQYDCEVAAHLTCVGSTVAELLSFLVDARSRGVANIVALRGDPPRGQSDFRPVEGGLSYANELVELIRGDFPDFGIAVAGYPETHVEATSAEDDLVNLRRKVDAGADVVITQVFYDNALFYRFRDSCERLGIKVPIVPGILPVTSLPQIKRITSMCGATLPGDFSDQLAAAGDDAEAQCEVGVHHATAQVQDLIDQGVPGVHFYVLNKSQSTSRVLGGVSISR